MFVQRILPAILVVIPAVVVAMVHDGRSEPAVDPCRTRPGLTAARGTHWYYRLDHVTKRQCWYLGLENAGRDADAKVPEVSAATPPVPVPRQKPAVIETVQQQQAAGVSPPELASTAALPPVELSVRNEQETADFAARWPNLPLTEISAADFRSQNHSGAKSSRLSSSYAEDTADEDVLPQAPVTWPVVDAVTAQPSTSMAVTLQPLYLAGGAVMALLFLAGWSFGQVRGRRIHVAPPLVPDCHTGNFESSVGVRTRTADRGRPIPTDPARDLKKSLGELMRDLHRAGAAVEARPLPVRKPKRRTAAAQRARLLETVD